MVTMRVIEKSGLVSDIRFRNLHWAREAARLLNERCHSNVRCAFVLRGRV